MPNNPPAVRGETIAALATPPGRAALAIIRVSGPDVAGIAARVIPDAAPLQPRTARHTRIRDRDGGVIDDGIALYFRAPQSATGEDVLELHVHGSPVIVETVIESLFAAGARAAGPGEFTRRAFLNGKLALHEAEAVGDLIAAEHRSAARAAAARLGGSVSRTIDATIREIRLLLEEISASVDYPDEVPDPKREHVSATIDAAIFSLEALVKGSKHGTLVREGARVAIVGPPNAGKSSLLNALLGEERVLVSPVAGTTRDTIEEALELDGVMIRLVDTAGIRAEADAIEAAGIERTKSALAQARLALVVVDGSQELSQEAHAVLAQTRLMERIVFYNKADIGSTAFASRAPDEAQALHGSVHRENTLSEIRAALREVFVGAAARIDLERPALTRVREVDAAYGALAALREAQATVNDNQPPDLLAGDLLEAVALLGKITGATASEEMLDGIFSRFCIGK